MMAEKSQERKLTEKNERKAPPKSVKPRAKGMVRILRKDGSVKAELPIIDPEAETEANEDRRHHHPE
jgi:hypothetical protein